MGLPVWRAPSPEPRDALKVQHGSPIRRRSSFAGRRARPTRSPSSPRLLDRLLDNDLATLNPSRFFEPADSSTRPSTSRPRLPPPPVPESRHYSRHAEPAARAPALASDISRSRRSTPLSQQSSTPPSSSQSPPQPRPRFDTADYRNWSDAADRVSSSSSWYETRPLPALTPNFAPAAASRTTRLEYVGSLRERSAARNRSPYTRISARPRSPWADRAIIVRGSDSPIVDDADEDNDNGVAVGSATLRRMGRRTIPDGPLPSSSLRESWSPATTPDLDGLGDRERSMSPGEDPWDTMLSTVAPDPIAPSADSSFTSAAASASFSNSHASSRASSNSNSGASSRTHLTIPSRRNSPPSDMFMRACDTSDDDTASDTEAEDVDSIRRRARLHTLGRSTPPPRNPHRYSRDVRERSRDAAAYVRSFLTPYNEQPRERPATDFANEDGEDGETVDAAEAAEPELIISEVSMTGNRLEEQLRAIRNAHGVLDDEIRDEIRDTQGLLDQELSDARVLLERLTRREDLPDEFWASVGLARSFADRVERIQHRERL
ncbi:hypothetical protein BS50DRAFT_623621 [Corynespora cassiicola Philippines]|uniref:Uncharacterized protein n=1 Tax=Corynespora cassiicola Philippines TaxID=1448308 RepID=A0A2T2NEU4_CORCC|nr:hypothetical protein BS50DRAFT_623621 [Corynespora cassiicola Philippines]